MRRFFLWLALLPSVLAASAPLISPENRLAPDAPGWRDLVERFAAQPDTSAQFEERRFFPFRKDPLVLKGEVRVSATRGLSLRYQNPDERIVILDAKGMLVRDAAGEKMPPPDPRARAANEALRHVLRFDFAALAKDFELYGRREGTGWTLALAPRAESIRRAIGDIFAEGDAAIVRRIELRRSVKQHIDIVMDRPKTAPFSGDELRQFFR